MMRLPVLSFLVLIVSMIFTSCEDYYEDYECTCPHGGVIDGWNDGDTTSVNQKDTTGGFLISVEKWGESETHDIHL